MAVPTPLPTLQATDCRDVWQNETALEVPDSRRRKRTTLIAFVKTRALERKHAGTQRHNADFLGRFPAPRRFLPACKTGSHLAPKCSRVRLLRAGAGLDAGPSLLPHSRLRSQYCS